MTTNQYETWISISAIVFALAFSWLKFWPSLVGLLIPYFDPGNHEKVGFIPLKSLFSAIPSFRGVALVRYIIPLFVTASLFFLMFIYSIFQPQIIKLDENLYFFAFIWFLSIMAAGKELSVLFISGIPFAIGWLIFRDSYYGYLAAFIILSIFISISVDANLWLSLITREIELETNHSLIGEPLKRPGKLLLRLRSSMWALELGAVALTLYAFWENSSFSPQDLVLRYMPEQPIDLGTRIVMLLLFINLSFRVFGGIFDYLQLDIFRILGVLLREKQLTQGQSPQDSASGNSNEALALLRLNIRPTDHIIDFYHLPNSGFHLALVYFSLDLLLTTSIVLGMPILPGMSLDQSSTLSTILKIPVMVVLGMRILYGLQVYMTVKSKTPYPSATYIQQMDAGKEYFQGISNLLRGVQKQRTSGLSYINLHNNGFLRELASRR